MVNILESYQKRHKYHLKTRKQSDLITSKPDETELAKVELIEKQMKSLQNHQE